MEQESIYKQPLVAWSKPVPSMFYTVALTYWLSKEGAILYKDVPEIFENRILNPPKRTLALGVVKSAVSVQHMEQHLMMKPSYISVTPDGVVAAHQKALRVEEYLQRSYKVMERWLLDLNPGIPVSETVEIGPQDLFDYGGLYFVHRALILNALQNHMAIDMDTQEPRAMFQNELMRFLERTYKWRVADSVINRIINEQREDGHLAAEYYKTYVPVNSADEKYSLKVGVELLRVTPLGRERLKEDLAPVRSILLRTKEVIDNWRDVLSLMGVESI